MKKIVSFLLSALMVLGLVPILFMNETYAATELVASGGDYLYDGLVHKVTANVVDGTGYTIEYSTDGGKTWTTEVPGISVAGTLTVNVRAIKGSSILIHDPVKIRIYAEAPAGSTITIVPNGSYTTAPIRKGPSTSSTKVGSIQAGETCTMLSKSGDWYEIEYGAITGYVHKNYVKITALPSTGGGGGGSEPADPSMVTLTATGGTFLYDGKEHKVKAKLQNGDGYTIEYSVNGGTNWTSVAPSLTQAGKLTVKVRATSSKGVVTHSDVVLEVLDSIPEGTVVYIKSYGGRTQAPIRESTSESSAKLGTIPVGNSCICIGVSGNWYHISYNGIVGYVYYHWIDAENVDLEHIITSHPSNASVNEGQQATFAVSATGATGYQWQYMKPGETTWNKVINNGTSATYKITTEARHNGYTYRCKVTSAAGSVYSNTAVLTVKTKPVITKQPTAVTVKVGSAATFKVVASGDPTYQWQYQKPDTSTWINVANNGKSATYKLTAEAYHDGYSYRCKLTNSVGTVYSATAKLTVNYKPVITTQPKAVMVNEGEKATFKVAATDATTYQWEYQKPSTSTWINVSINGTSATYKLTTKAYHNGYTYRCKVSNALGTVYSNAVKLTVKSKPVITAQPTAVTVNEGQTATFKVIATGDPTYQWQYKKPSSTTWIDVINNGTSATYNLTTKAYHNGYTYRCKVSNALGTVYTSAVKLTVN